MPVVTFTAGTSTTPLGKGRDGGVGARGVLEVFFSFCFFSVFRILFFFRGRGCVHGIFRYVKCTPNLEVLLSRN